MTFVELLSKIGSFYPYYILLKWVIFDPMYIKIIIDN